MFINRQKVFGDKTGEDLKDRGRYETTEKNNTGDGTMCSVEE